MKKFRFKHTPLVWTLLAVVIAVLLGSVIWNVITLINRISLGSTKIYASILLIIAGLFLLVFALSVVLFSSYTVKKDLVVLRFGLISSKLKIKEIVQFTHFKKSDKLVSYFEDAKYTVIVIDSRYYEQFINAVREQNQKIVFDSCSEEEKEA